ncbi:MAG: ABC transporter permease [Chromatiales bacterium]|jgi:peptide/nickel transport system permease protein|nr:ABC transporter permease [Chromatiales bacterium]
MTEPVDEVAKHPRALSMGGAEPMGLRARRWKQQWSEWALELYRSKTGLIGAVMLLSVFTVCGLAPVLATHNPLKVDVPHRLETSSSEHVLGTDRFGRDMYSRVLWGGRRLLVVALLAVSLGLVLGVPLGLYAGYRGGWVDGLSMRFVDALLAFPGILLFMLFMTLAQAYKLEGAARDAILVTSLGLAFMPETARLMRGTMLNERSKEYVEAAQVMGNSTSYIIAKEILPNCISPLIVHSTVYLGIVLLAVAALSYLGLGTPPPTPDWGSDLRAATDYMEQVPSVAMVPGIAISYTVLAFNLLGDGLRDILDPRLAEQ